MRHSQATALRNYKKVFNVAKEPEVELKNCNQIVAQKELQIRDLQNKLTTYEETKPDQLHFRKMRRDVIFQLNKFKRTPRQSTIDKYDIKIVDGKYT